jgi:asparagine synthase (glutamine-hydrolysing)
VTATAARVLRDTDARILAFTSVPRPGNQSGAPANRNPNEGELAAATASMYPNVDHIFSYGHAASPIADLNLYVDLFDRPVYNLCNFAWLTDIRREAQRRQVKILLTGENGNWTISSGPPTVLADLIRERRWLQWWREANALTRNKGARLRGIAANSFGPWLPDVVWNRFRRMSWRPEVASYTALHPRLEPYVQERREMLRVGLARRPKDNFAETVNAFQHYDFGDVRAGTLAGWQVEERDPTSDRRLIEFCLSLPVDMLLKDGIRRPLARAAWSDRVPQAVLTHQRKGYQAADWHEGMTYNLPAIRDLIEEIGANDLAASIIDVNSLRAWVRDWPSGGWEVPQIMARYRGALLGALSAGHFILAASR